MKRRNFLSLAALLPFGGLLGQVKGMKEAHPFELILRPGGSFLLRELKSGDVKIIWGGKSAWVVPIDMGDMVIKNMGDREKFVYDSGCSWPDDKVWSTHPSFNCNHRVSRIGTRDRFLVSKMVKIIRWEGDDLIIDLCRYEPFGIRTGLVSG